MWYDGLLSTGTVGYGKELNYPGYLGQCMAGRVSYLGRVKQGYYHTHGLYTIPNPNDTLPKPYSFISMSISMLMQNFIKYSKRFKSYRHFSKSSRTGQGQNLHKLSDDKIKCLTIGHSMKFNFKFQLTFLGSCNFNSMFFLKLDNMN